MQATKKNQMKAESNLQRFEDHRCSNMPCRLATGPMCERETEFLWMKKGKTQLCGEKKKKIVKEKEILGNHDVTKDIYLFGEPEYKQK